MSAALERLQGALAPGLTIEQRGEIISNVRKDLGLELRRWNHAAPDWIVRFSMFASGLKAIIISKRVDEQRQRDGARAQLDFQAALIHELVHAARARGFFWGLWRAVYLLSPSFRRAEEMEADAFGIALRARVCSAQSHSPLVHDLARSNARQWTGWRRPYLCGGDLDTYTAALIRRVRALLGEP